ncbi:MAG: hypothetical protein Tsb002_36400 [Wenzhouxiangellaceae bacterium]
MALNGERIWAATVGWAEIEPQQAATVATIYRIGSTSKALTATAMARLVDADMLDLERPLATYLDALPNAQWGEMTPRMLASHTAGLPGYYGNRDLWGVVQTLHLGRRFTDVEQALDVFDATPLLFEPGQGFHYSSFNTTLNAYLMQQLSGQAYPRLMQDWVFEPLAMSSTQVEDQAHLPVTLAHFYRLYNNRVRPWRPTDLSVKWAGGGLLSTPSDLVRLGSAWLDPDFISAATRERFWTPQLLANGEVNEQSYALGWRASPTERFELAGQPLMAVHHGGVSNGAMSWLVIYPEIGLVVALNMNTRIDVFRDFASAETRLTRLLLQQLGD